jgi:hypothetical protein
MKSRLYITIAIITFCTLSLNAQTKSYLSIGGGYSTYKASGNAKNTSGFGLDISAKTALSERVEGFAETGYNAYLNNGFNVAYIPLQVGVNVKINNFRPGIGIGYGSSTASGSTTGGFTLNPQVGYHLNNIDFVLHYTSTSLYTGGTGTWNMFGFKILHKVL